MAKDISLHTGSALATNSNTPGSSSSTAGYEWNSPAPFLGQHSDVEKIAPGHGAVAENLVQLAGVRRRGTTGVQERLGFRAYPKKIVVMRFERAVSKNANAWKPSGPWALVEHSEFKAISTPIRRSGTVAMERLASAPHPSTTPSTASPKREYEAATDAVSFLPPSVQRDVLSLADPIHFIGTLLHYAADRGQGEQQIQLLRMNGAEALVINASRPDSATAAWKIESYRFSFDARKQIGG